MKTGDTVYYIDSRQIKEGELINCFGGFATLRFKKAYPELVGGRTFLQNCGIRIRINRVYDCRQKAQAALSGYN